MSNLQRGFIAPLLLALIALLILGGGAYVYMQNKQVSQSAVVTETTQATSTTPTSEIETLKDGVYDNFKDGFQFQVPSTWKLMPVYLPVFITSSGARILGTQSFFESPDLDRVLQGGEGGATWEWKQGATIYISVNASTTIKFKDLQKFGRSYQDKSGQNKLGPEWINVKTIKVAGEDALIYDLPATGDSTETHFFAFLHNDLWIRGNIQYKGLDGQKIFDKLLATFKFTK